MIVFPHRGTQLVKLTIGNKKEKEMDNFFRRKQKHPGMSVSHILTVYRAEHVRMKAQKNLLMAPGVLAAIKHKQVSLEGAD